MPKQTDKPKKDILIDINKYVTSMDKIAKAKLRSFKTQKELDDYMRFPKTAPIQLTDQPSR
jgi:hypothetical protein